MTKEDVASIVAGWTGIPVTRLTEGEAERLLKLEDGLHQRVIGQDEAVTAVAKAVRRARAGLKDPTGPSVRSYRAPGVGKTRWRPCRISSSVMRSHDRLDMSEYMERHTVSRMIGASAVGYEEAGQLTEASIAAYSVVLFDK